MHTQTSNSTKIKKQTAKRRNRNKRRRKLRHQRKVQEFYGEKVALPPKKRTIKLDPQQQSEKWEALCLETFQRLTTWQCEAELNFWKARTEYLQNENKQLKQELEMMKKESEERFTEEQDRVDPGYLEFIAITQKHREELKQARSHKSEDRSGVD